MSRRFARHFGLANVASVQVEWVELVVGFNGSIVLLRAAELIKLSVTPAESR